jgi:LacI family transcriptional regulator
MMRDGDIKPSPIYVPKVLGRSPHAEIRAVQVGRATQLLQETDLPLKRISAECGFAHMEYLSYLFKRAFGVSPGAYRRLHSRRGRWPKPTTE